MQKKICFLLMGYLVLISIAGIWFAFQKRMNQFPLLEEAIVWEILPQPEELADSPDTDEPAPSAGSTVSKSQSNLDAPNYWEQYQSSGAGLAEGISAADKLRVIYIIKKNLNSDDINLLFFLARDGLSTDEQSEIKALLRRKLNEEDRAKLKEVVLKYF